MFQVVKARVSTGDWSRELLVPFAQDVDREVRWAGDARLTSPAPAEPIQLQLGKTRLQLPAKITLKQFDLIPYAGGDKRQGSMFRDFKSTARRSRIRTRGERDDRAWRT